MIKTIGFALLGFGLLDGLWLGIVMKGFYRDHLAPIARMHDGAIAPVWPAAIAVYLLLAVGIGVFVIPRSGDWIGAALGGALFGVVVYGVYDFTNYATLAHYPLVLALVDIGWGTAASAVCAAAVRAAIDR